MSDHALIICLAIFIGSALFLFWPRTAEWRLDDPEDHEVKPGGWKRR